MRPNLVRMGQKGLKSFLGYKLTFNLYGTSLKLPRGPHEIKNAKDGHIRFEFYVDSVGSIPDDDFFYS